MMGKIKKIWYLLLFLPYLAEATHIVGGVLNYVYNGNNIYTITLKLYRDCGPSAAAFPNSVVIEIQGNNGAAFSPSKDLTMNKGTVTTLSANTLPCALQPNPKPCVQEGIYTKTVSLPPNTGGYHLYYQIEARNLSLTNINASCNCIGESFYAYIPDNSNSANNNSNAEFSAFPPLFLCVNEPFTFNHSATDANGDSLVYSLYAPFNGDNGAGTLDPTFTNNTASFTPVVYNTGYNANNPLGATPFNLDPFTGVLTGTPGTIGQFVVGVRVKEYRNGVMISQTLRDFQFNVLQCPTPPGKLSMPDININQGCTLKLSATGISSTTVKWNSINPGTIGAYNSKLTCTTCLTPSISGTSTVPAFIDYQVCGTMSACVTNSVCDTFRVHFNPPLQVIIAPANPALCNGQTSTTLIATGSGGSPPYSYLWNNTNPSQSITVGAGTYNVKLTDISGCPPALNSVQVISYSVPVTANAGPDRTVCITNPGTSLTATITGATGGIWSGGTGTFSPGNTTTGNMFYTPSSAELSAGVATLIITTTGNGQCPLDRDTVRIFYTPFIGTITVTPTNVSCFGGNNGAASATVIGGSFDPQTYVWNTAPAQTLSIASNLVAGNYSVTVTNSIGCVSTKTVSITQPQPLAINPTITNVTCNGGANGVIKINVVGGTAPYTYTWSTSAQNTTSISGLAAGNYSVSVADSKSCPVTSTFNVTQPTSVTIVSTQSNVNCFGGNNGSISTTVSGGNSPYSYTWSPGGASSANISSLTAGVYTLSTADNFSCSSTKVFTITQPSSITVTSSFTNETCSYLNNGAASATAVGGTPGYTYTWLPGSLTGSNVSNLASGNYTVNVSDTKGCIASNTLTITQPATLTIVPSNKTNVSCFGGTNGSLTANVSGGTPGYTYTWSPVAGTGSVLTGVQAGNYTVTTRDTQSCIASATFAITQPASLTVSSIITTVSCFSGSNGAISLTPGGGVSPFSYFWLPGGQTTSSISSVSAGNYTSMVTDANGCVKTNTFNIAQGSTLSIAFTTTNVSCFTGSNGIVVSSVSGGSSPYTYTWSPSTANTSSISNLTAGNYTLNISDVLGCTSSKTVTVTQPSLLTISVTHTDETCDYLNNGIASASAGGGTPAYTFSWQPGGSTAASVSSLSAGNYTAKVTDSKGCTATTVVAISQPTALSVAAVTIIPVKCFGGSDGSASVQGAGGTPNYNYTWSPGGSNSSVTNSLVAGTYTVKVSDSHSCIGQNTLIVAQPATLSIASVIGNVSCFGGSDAFIALTPAGGNSPYSFFWLPNGQTTSSITGLSAGNYSTQVTDSKGCQSGANFTITQSTSLTVAFTTTNVSCFLGSNGKATATASGGNAPYTYSWSTSATIQSISGLTAGIYTVTVTDNFSCTTTRTVQITQPTQLAIAASVTNESCNYNNDGIASAVASGGTPNYTYSWVPGSMTGSNVTGLSSGNYTVTATDNLGCTINTVVSVTEPSSLAVTFTNVINVSCNGGSNGSALAFATGGTPNYSYTWSPGGLNSAMINSLSIGQYTVKASDAKGCIAQNTVIITEPAPLLLVPTISSVICNGGTNGQISVSTNGGTGPYSYTLQPGNIAGVNFTGLSAGIYSIETSDALGCFHSVTIALTQPVSLSAAVSVTNAGCLAQTGIATISVTSGGAPPFTYSWVPTGGTGTITNNLFAGTYTVEIKDSLGCVAKKLVNISSVGAPTVGIVSYTNVSCFGGSNAALTATHSLQDGPHTYTWVPSGGNGLTASNLSSGIYVIQVKDNLGCIGFATSTLVAEPAQLNIVMSTTNVSCFAGNNGKAFASVTGGTPNYTITWSGGVASGASVSGLSDGIYTVQVIDSKSCSQSATFAITQPTAVVSMALNSTSVSCFNGSDGAAAVIPTGGTRPYSAVWQPGNLSGISVSNLTAGTYTATVTDLKGCTAQGTVSVIPATSIAVTASNLNSNCNLANGQASVNATGGTGIFSYLWSPSGGTTFSATGLAAGGYTIKVTDSNNCNASVTTTISDNPAQQVSVVTASNVSCFGGSNGAATAIVTGGTGPFTYSWTSGSTFSTATGLSSGTYTVVVTSANTCTVAAVSALISQPTKVLVSLATYSLGCFAVNNGSAVASGFGGTGAYTFTWQAGVASGATVTSLAAGVYSMQIADANNCTQSATFAITQPTAALSLAVSSSSVLCAGGTNGSATVIAAGGTAPYSFTWSPGAIGGSTISNLSAGTYSVNARDLNGCAAQNTVQVIPATPITTTINTINSNCSLANGQAMIGAGGGTGVYSYQWSPLGGNSFTAGSLPAGSYTVTVVDSNTCTATATAQVNDNPAPLVSISTITNVTCFGGSNGAATASVSGGTAPFTYSWTSGSTFSTATGLQAGTHTVLVTSFNGCTVSAVSPVVTQPLKILVNITTYSVGCFASNSGSAIANVFGGTGAYTYTWQAGTVNGATVTGLGANTYTMLVADAANCTQTSSFSINQPAAALALVLSSSSVSCFGGSNGTASVSASGGTSPYGYFWTPVGGSLASATGLSAGMYSVTVTDLNGCGKSGSVQVIEPTPVVATIISATNVSCFGGSNGSASLAVSGGNPTYNIQWSPAGGTSLLATGLSLGTYVATVSDINSCQTQVSVIISEPPLLTGTLAVIRPSCGRANGALMAQISGGTTPYTYAWTPGAMTTPVATSLAAGSYTVIVKDAKNCQKILSETLIDIPGPSVVSNGKTNVLCFGQNNGSATISINQGTGPFTISWLPFGGTDSVALNLTAGTFTAFVTDALGCQNNNAVFTITQPPALAVSISSLQNVLCFGAQNGSLSALASGGTPAYSYSWSTAGVGDTVSHLAPGTYTVFVNDANNCKTALTANITQPAVLTSSLSNVVNALCFSGNGSANVVMSGGTSPFSYTWTSSPAQYGSSMQNVPAGTYSVFVVDKNGCSVSDVVTITQPSIVATSVTSLDTVCAGKVATLVASATGGSGNYYFSWMPGAVTNSGTFTFQTNSPVSYTVLAFDKNGCSGAEAVEDVGVWDLNSSNLLLTGYTPICPGATTTINGLVTGPTGPVTFSWSHGLGSSRGDITIRPTKSTTYSLTVTNACGKTIMDSVTVLISPPPVVRVSSDTAYTCIPGIVNFQDKSGDSNSGDPIVSWDWDFGDGEISSEQNPSHTYTAQGVYTVNMVVTTDRGCTNTADAPIIVKTFPQPVAAFTLNSYSFDLPYEELQATNQSTDAVAFYWEFGKDGTSNLPNPKFLLKTVGTVTIMLVATSNQGCVDTAYTTVTTGADLIFPNAFTPGEQGSSGGFYVAGNLDNNIFFPYTSGVVDYNLQIFNRWGELIFETYDVKEGWDGYYRGKLCQLGVYVWKAKVTLTNGKVFDKAGNVTLLR